MNRSQVNEVSEVKRGHLSLAGRHQSRLGGMSELKTQKGKRHPESEGSGSQVKPRATHHKSNSSPPPGTSSSSFPKSSVSAAFLRSPPQTKNPENMKQSTTNTRRGRSHGSPTTPLPLDEEFTARAAQERRARTTASGGEL